MCVQSARPAKTAFLPPPLVGEGCNTVFQPARNRVGQRARATGGVWRRYKSPFEVLLVRARAELMSGNSSRRAACQAHRLRHEEELTVGKATVMSPSPASGGGRGGGRLSSFARTVLPWWPTSRRLVPTSCRGADPILDRHPSYGLSDKGRKGSEAWQRLFGSAGKRAEEVS